MVRPNFFFSSPYRRVTSLTLVSLNVRGTNTIRCPRAGFNHSGKENVFNFLNGPMGFANAQRMVNYIRIFAEFMSQPEYVNVVPMFGIINEPRADIIGVDTLASLCVAVSTFVLGSVNTHPPAIWKFTMSSVPFRVLVKARAHSSQSAMVP